MLGSWGRQYLHLTLSVIFLPHDYVIFKSLHAGNGILFDRKVGERGGRLCWGGGGCGPNVDFITSDDFYQGELYNVYREVFLTLISQSYFLALLS